MKIEPFALERWMTAHELSASYDMAESSILPSTNDFFAFEEPKQRQAILKELFDTPLGYSEASDISDQPTAKPKARSASPGWRKSRSGSSLDSRPFRLLHSAPGHQSTEAQFG